MPLSTQKVDEPGVGQRMSCFFFPPKKSSSEDTKINIPYKTPPVTFWLMCFVDMPFC